MRFRRSAATCSISGRIFFSSLPRLRRNKNDRRVGQKFEPVAQAFFVNFPVLRPLRILNARRA